MLRGWLLSRHDILQLHGGGRAVVAVLHATELSVVASQWYWVVSVLETAAYCYAVREQELSSGDVRLLCATQYLLVTAAR
jgi:hypothetical protein